MGLTARPALIFARYSALTALETSLARPAGKPARSAPRPESPVAVVARSRCRPGSRGRPALAPAGVPRVRCPKPAVRGCSSARVLRDVSILAWPGAAEMPGRWPVRGSRCGQPERTASAYLAADGPRTGPLREPPGPSLHVDAGRRPGSRCDLPAQGPRRPRSGSGRGGGWTWAAGRGRRRWR